MVNKRITVFIFALIASFSMQHLLVAASGDDYIKIDCLDGSVITTQTVLRTGFDYFSGIEHDFGMSLKEFLLRDRKTDRGKLALVPAEKPMVTISSKRRFSVQCTRRVFVCILEFIENKDSSCELMIKNMKKFSTNELVQFLHLIEYLCLTEPLLAKLEPILARCFSDVRLHKAYVSGDHSIASALVGFDRMNCQNAVYRYNQNPIAQLFSTTIDRTPSLHSVESADGTHYAVITPTGIKLFTSDTHTPVLSMDDGTFYRSRLHFSADLKRVSLDFDYNKVCVIDLDTKKVISLLENVWGPSSSLSLDGETVAFFVPGRSQTIRVVDVTSGESLYQIKLCDWLKNHELSFDGKKLALLCNGKLTLVSNYGRSKKTINFKETYQTVNCLKFSKPENLIVLWGEKKIIVIDTIVERVVFSLKNENSLFYARVAISNNEKLLAAADFGHYFYPIRIIDIRSGCHLYTVSDLPGVSNFLRFTDDSKSLIARKRDGVPSDFSAVIELLPIKYCSIEQSYLVAGLRSHKESKLHQSRLARLVRYLQRKPLKKEPDPIILTPELTELFQALPPHLLEEYRSSVQFSSTDIVS